MSDSLPLSTAMLPTPDVGNIHDLRSLNSLRNLAQHDEKAALKAAAEQFESVMLQQMLKSMREANEVFEDDDFFGDRSHVDTYEQMHDEQLAASLAKSQSLGLAELMVRQLSKAGVEPNVSRESKPLQGTKAGIDTTAPVSSQPAAANPALQPRPPLAAAGNSEPVTPASFVRSILPHAEAAAKALGVDARLLVAQAALESGWGAKVLPAATAQGSSHQYFGIKADARWLGQTVSAQTLEYREGMPQRERASFRAYDSVAAAFSDYVQFVQGSPRYADALSKAADPTAYAEGLQRGGYATDPAYARKLISLFHSEKLTSLVEEARKLL